MTPSFAVFVVASIFLLASCAKKESSAAPANPEPPAAVESRRAPHAVVHLKDGTKVSGTIVASSQTDMVVAGDDSIERKIPMAQVKSVEYGEALPARAAERPASLETAPSHGAAGNAPGPAASQVPRLPPSPRGRIGYR